MTSTFIKRPHNRYFEKQPRNKFYKNAGDFENADLIPKFRSKIDCICENLVEPYRIYDLSLQRET